MMRSAKKNGFTLVEVLVISPIIILTIGAFIIAIVTMTGGVLASRAQNSMTYDVQDALSRIEQDVNLSTTFLGTNNFNLSAGQGRSSDTTKFQVNNTTLGDVLIINSLVTNESPLSQNAKIVYLANTPHSCGGSYFDNRPLEKNIVYFVEDNTLWRRTILPASYDSNICDGPSWDLPSCKAGTYNSSSFCKVDDVRVLDDVASGGFRVSYFNKVSDGTSIVVAPSISGEQKTSVLAGAQTVAVEIRLSKFVAGRELTRTESIRATRLESYNSAVGN